MEEEELIISAVFVYLTKFQFGKDRNLSHQMLLIYLRTPYRMETS